MMVTIIIPAYNAAATLAECLDACLKQSHAPTEVIVVDDGSTDDTPRIAGQFPVEFVRQEQQGPAAARNHGARVAKGELLIFTDSDCVPEPHWVQQLVDCFEEGVAAAGGTYGIANNRSLLARMVHEEIVMRHRRFGKEVDFLGSFNVAIRREAFERVGGFDESFRAASGEDNDLSYRLRDMGGRLCFAHDAVVRHYHPTRLWPYLKAQARHGFWRVKLYQKHPGRASGDRYAGLVDLAAPPLTAVCAALLVCALFSAISLACAMASAVIAAILVLARISIPWRMARQTGEWGMLAFLPVMLLRDAARAAGMLWGFWRFVILRKASA
ncbi:MAG: glycosyltransferase [Candidatus Hydrogenedentes bacterium]|nr:glycosyltransferase [Candidatus Hydrogenedentota bacterium]